MRGLLTVVAMCAGMSVSEAVIAQGTKVISEPALNKTCLKSDIDINKLNKAIKWISDSKPNLHSLLVNYCGQTILEDYFFGYDSIMPHDLQSATKTVTSMLIGIALYEGVIKSVDQPLSELLPDYADLLKGDKANITLRQVLDMTTGLEWRDFRKGNSFELIAEATDSVEFVLSRPLVSKPGEVFYYNTGSSHLLSAIIATNTGMSTLEYAEKKLFGPMEMFDYEWDTLRDNIHLGGWGLYLRPRDMVKIGRMILDGGTWNGKRFIDEAYIEQATQKQVATGGGPGGNGYGFQMWILNDQAFDDIAAARGYGGQNIFVIDKLDMVIVTTASVESHQKNDADIMHLLSQYVIPAHSGQMREHRKQ